MSATESAPVPSYDTLALTRTGRVLTITLNRPAALNAVNLAMHDDLAEVFGFAATDQESDIVVLTGAGRAFSAGGDLDHMARNAAQPELFDHETVVARRIVLAMLDIDKPLICRLNGHAVGLGATLALLSDVIFAADTARIGDPHVLVGLVAGDGGAIVWPLRIGFARAKEYLLTGELLGAAKARDIGLINHCVPAEELDAAVDALCQRLLQQSPQALRGTKHLINMELKRITGVVLEAGLALEAETARSAAHRSAVDALRTRRATKPGGVQG
jgi:enoyl-CoA hydratase